MSINTKTLGHKTVTEGFGLDRSPQKLPEAFSGRTGDSWS